MERLTVLTIQRMFPSLRITENPSKNNIVVFGKDTDTEEFTDFCISNDLAVEEINEYEYLIQF
jgi:hypothetical protein